MDKVEMKKFEELIGGALKKFDDQNEQISALQNEVSYLKGRLESRSAFDEESAPIFRGVRVPWESKDSAKSFVDFCRALVSKDDQTVRAMAEGTDADGGYLVPQEFQPTLLRIIEQYGVLRRVATVIPMPREELKFPTFSGGWNDTNGAVTGPVYWVGENAAITETWPQFGDTLLAVKKLAALIPTSGELLQDSTIPIASLIATLVGEFIAQEEDRVGFVGDITGNSDAFDGALTTAGNVVTMATGDQADVTADNLMDMITATPKGALNGAMFYMSRSVFAHLRKLKGNDGHYIFDPPQGSNPGSFFGYGYELVESMPTYTAGAGGADTRFVLFGNMKQYYLGDRMALSVAASDQVGFANFQTHFRFVERIGMKTAIANALTALKTSA